MEQKYQIGTNSGTILWNISEMLKYTSQYAKQLMKVDDLVKNNFFSGQIEHAMGTDINNPIVVINLCDGKDKVIDGNHRLFKARNHGIEYIEAYYLKQNQHTRYIENYDEELYEVIVSEF